MTKISIRTKLGAATLALVECAITKRYLIRDIPRTLLEVHIVDFQVEGCINQLIIDKNYLPIDDKND